MSGWRKIAGLRVFRKAEDGSVTVDWVVLTAAIIGLCAVAFIPLFASTDGVANTIATSIIAHVNAP